RADRLEVRLAPELRRRVTLQREETILGRHPPPVVGHRDELAAGTANRDLDPGRAGVEAVLHQLLDDGRWALDHLAGRALVCDGVGKALDCGPAAHGAIPNLPNTGVRP